MGDWEKHEESHSIRFSVLKKAPSEYEVGMLRFSVARHEVTALSVG